MWKITEPTWFALLLHQTSMWQPCLGTHCQKLLGNYRTQLLGQRGRGGGVVMWSHSAFLPLFWAFTSVCQGGFCSLGFTLQISLLLSSCECSCKPLWRQRRGFALSMAEFGFLFCLAASHLKPCSSGDYQSCFSCLVTVKSFILTECENVSFGASNDFSCHWTRALCK